MTGEQQMAAANPENTSVWPFGKSTKAHRSTSAEWLRIAVVSIGLGAALATCGQGVATAAPGTATNANSADSSSNTAKSSRSNQNLPSKTVDQGTVRSRGLNKPTKPTARNSPSARLTTHTPTSEPGAVASDSTSASITAADRVLGEIKFGNQALTPKLPVLPLGGLVETVWLFARQSESTRIDHRPSLLTASAAGGSPDTEMPGTAVGPATGAPATRTAIASTARAVAKTESEREAADAAVNGSLGWVPVFGTLYNGLSLVQDFVEFSSAVTRGDVADVLDEIGDMTKDVIGMVPVIGGPIAALVYHVLTAVSTPVNHLPNAVTDNYTMNEDTSLTNNLLANDTDADGDPLTAALNTLPAHGSASVNADGSFTYTPAANYYGTDSFSYTVGDGSGSVSVGTVNITVIDVAEPPPPSPFTRPVNGYRITQEYGNGHTGIDLAVASGTPVYAAADGVIYFEGWGTDGNNGARSNWMGSSAGISVLVQHNGLGIMTGYAHLSRTIVDQGQTVSKGQVIGYVGCTGTCTGPHLHFEVLPMPLNSRNGISGRVNPRNYLSL